MRRTLRGSSLFEVILYVGLFAVMATAFLQFSLNVLDLGIKDKVARHIASDARFTTERIDALLRAATGIDTGASVFDDDQGEVVLHTVGSSDTVTLRLRDGSIILEETGEPDVALTSPEAEVVSLRFLDYGDRSDGSEYVGYVLTLRAAGGQAVRSQYQASMTIEGGATLRNDDV